MVADTSMAQARRVDRSRAPLRSLLLATALAAGVAADALAQVRTVQAAVQSTLTATNNGAGAPAGQEESDLVLNIQPSLRIDRRSAGLTLVGEAGVSLITTANKTRPDRALPNARLSADATLVERLMQLQSSLSVGQVERDPFAARVDPTSPENAVTATTFQLSPSIRHEFSPLLSFTARDNEVWTRYSGDLENDNHARQTTVRIERKPSPFGASLDAIDEALTYRDAPAGDWRARSFLASASYSFAGEWVLGAFGGVERSSFDLSTETDSRKGIRLFWSPGPRTELLASAERRYFGNGGDLRIRHRTPGMAIVVRVLREPSAGGNLPGTAAAGNRLEEFLDAILTTRYPDPALRAAEVAGLMATRGLQGELQGAAGINANYPQLRTGGEASLVLLSTRHLLTITTYAQSLRQLTRSDGRLLTPLPADADARQIGGAIGLNRRLSPVTALEGQGRWSRIEGTGLRAGDDTRESQYRLTLNRSLSPRTGASFGMQYRSVRGTTAATGTFKETSAFLGMAHRF